MAARTKNVRFSVAALIAPFYDPLRLAEDMMVIDHFSQGRVDLIVAGGYVGTEFAMYGVPGGERGQRVEEVVQTLRGAFSGEPFEYRGRTVHVKPGPWRSGGPTISLGGSSDAAARRAARTADGFLPTTPEVWGHYRDERAKLGRSDPGPCPVKANQTIALAADPEQAWQEMGPFFLHETNSYGAWLAANNGTGSYQLVDSVENLRARGNYRILTPDEFTAELRTAPSPFAMLHPLCGGIPPELAWPSLRLFENAVLPTLAQQ